MGNEAAECLRMRVHGDAALPTLVYLPGLHGDWTLIGGVRAAVAGRFRFVEFTYPRTLTWSLEDYANAVAGELTENGITSGWLLAESFGSQVAWPLAAADNGFEAKGIVLAGGFGAHPFQLGVRAATGLCGCLPMSLITKLLLGYLPIARWRFRRSPEVLAGTDEFVARRTELDKRAATWRLQLIMRNDPRELVGALRIPVWHLSGFWDPIVFWAAARRWLRRYCRDYRGDALMGTDHTVLAGAPERSVEIIAGWIRDRRPKDLR